MKEYVYPVGRLDYDTEGLLLLTNDGDLAARLTHPRHGVERTYEARVAGMPDEEAVERLRRGMTEGRNRQVRRMLEAVGHPVKKLMRVGIGPLSDRGLKPGHWRELTRVEVEKLKSGKVEK